MNIHDRFADYTQYGFRNTPSLWHELYRVIIINSLLLHRIEPQYIKVFIFEYIAFYTIYSIVELATNMKTWHKGNMIRKLGFNN